MTRQSKYPTIKVKEAKPNKQHIIQLSLLILIDTIQSDEIIIWQHTFVHEADVTFPNFLILHVWLQMFKLSSISLKNVEKYLSKSFCSISLIGSETPPLVKETNYLCAH